MAKGNHVHLLTKWGRSLPDIPWSKYPRPQLVRDSFFCLNGKWEFASGSEAPSQFKEEITVPFPPQSILSGICRNFEAEEKLFYRRKFELPEGFLKDILLLNIGACDQECSVYINEQYAGGNIGGYNSFSLDITDLLQDGENEILIEVFDDPELVLLPYGKQRKKRGGMWYTPISGIWQSIWLESVPKAYIKSIKTTTSDNNVSMVFEGIESGHISVETSDGKFICEIADSMAEFKISEPRKWSPEDPYLYRFTAVSDQDHIESYFALRDLEIAEIDGIKRPLLNGKPYYFHGLLDQGYYSDGIYTPAAEEAYAFDISAMKNMGFNMLRKHIKIEPERFYYECDRLGMIVFQDMVNNSDYSFIRDTALPTIGIKKLNDKRLHKNTDERAAFISGMETTVAQLFNHPSICQWTIFNEGWGQFCSSDMYDLLRGLDSTRFIDSASGWFESEKSDFYSPHIYFKPIKLSPKSKPIFISEFGGYSCKIEGHCFNLNQEFGYRHFDTTEEFSKALEELYIKQVIPSLKCGVCGSVYTQVSDVEDETNGLLTYDRAEQKIETTRMKSVSDKLFDAFKQSI